MSRPAEVRNLEFDPDKDQANIRKHGISLARAAEFEIMIQFEDRRRNHGETRWRSFGMIDGQLHFLAFTVRNGRLRPISLRPSKARELRRYGIF